MLLFYDEQYEFNCSNKVQVNSPLVIFNSSITPCDIQINNGGISILPSVNSNVHAPVEVTDPKYFVSTNKGYCLFEPYDVDENNNQRYWQFNTGYDYTQHNIGTSYLRLTYSRKTSQIDQENHKDCDRRLCVKIDGTSGRVECCNGLTVKNASANIRSGLHVFGPAEFRQHIRCPVLYSDQSVYTASLTSTHFYKRMGDGKTLEICDTYGTGSIGPYNPQVEVVRAGNRIDGDIGSISEQLFSVFGELSMLTFKFRSPNTDDHEFEIHWSNNLFRNIVSVNTGIYRSGSDSNNDIGCRITNVSTNAIQFLINKPRDDVYFTIWGKTQI